MPGITQQVKPLNEAKHQLLVVELVFDGQFALALAHLFAQQVLDLWNKLIVERVKIHISCFGLCRHPRVTALLFYNYSALNNHEVLTAGRETPLWQVKRGNFCNSAQLFVSSFDSLGYH